MSFNILIHMSMSIFCVPMSKSRIIQSTSEANQVDSCLNVVGFSKHVKIILSFNLQLNPNSVSRIKKKKNSKV